MLNPEEYIMPFGKYRGDTLQEIYETNYSYLLWVYENFDKNDVYGVIEEFFT